MTTHHEQLILKLLNGIILPDEQVQLDAWMNELPENKKTADDFILMWKLSQDTAVTPEFQTSEEWLKLESAIHRTQRLAGREIQFDSTATWLKMAASVSFIILCSWLLYLIVFNHEIILKESHDTLVQLALPDGSEVWLNHNSRLAYQDDFNGKDRIVKLEGEAFFDVKKDAKKPFIIQTKQAQIKVLGTSFNVQAYEQINQTEVFVVTGLVGFSSFRNSTNVVTLKPGETGALGKNNTIVVLHTSKNSNALAWKEKKLMFKGTAVQEVIESLEEYFRIHIEVQNQNVLRCRFTGSFTNPTLNEIIEALGVSLDLNITKQDNTYVVDGEGC